VSGFVESAPDPVARPVFANALCVEDGQGALPKLQTAGEECAFLRPGSTVFAEDGSTVSVARRFVVDGFYNRCSTADAEWASAQLCAGLVAPLMGPLHLTSDGFGSVPTVYLGSRDDRVLPWWFQAEMSKAEDLIVHLLKIAANGD
jgi:hypothetical protein